MAGKQTKDQSKSQSSEESTNADDSKRRATKPKALSLNIGLNAVSPAAYGGWSGDLAACEFDANDMEAIAKSKGMKVTKLLTGKATRAATLAGIRGAAKALKSGGFFFLTYSGHGGQVPDVTGEEDDKRDETWCLFDGQLIDDELYFELSKFAGGVRVLVLSDSCHSGTVVRALPPLMPGIAPGVSPDQRVKLMPEAVAMRTYREHKEFYDTLQRDVAAAAGNKPVDPDTALAGVAVSTRLTSIAGSVSAAILLISGCQDNQTSMDGMHNGAFTEQLLRVWNNGKFVGNYASFHAQVRSRLPSTQSPNLFALGPTASFVKQIPFTV